MRPPDEASFETFPRLWHVARAASAWPGVVDAVCGDGNLTVIADSNAVLEAIDERLRLAWDAAPAHESAHRTHEVPVAYGGANGPDLAELAQRAGLSEAAIVARHTAAEYVVLFLGFLPGFAYLGGLDSQLAAPRRAVPRTAVPAGSVGIGGDRTGIYPAGSPGGWNLIGRTDAVLFDPQRGEPALLAPGDRVRFVSV